MNRANEARCDEEGYVDQPGADFVNGAKTGAVATADDELAWLVDIWSALPEVVRAEVIGVARRALPESIAGPF